MPPPPTLTTDRLVLRPLDAGDAAFTLELLNDPDYVRFIADRGVRTTDDARRYLENGPLAMYARHGTGLLLVERRSDRAPIGMCGLLRRDELPEPDLGFAFLPAFRGAGYAHEAAEAVLAWSRDVRGDERLVAIALAENSASLALLDRLGFRREAPISLRGESLLLYGLRFH